MKIKADKEAQEIIYQLCDVALKSAGVSNLKVINAVLSSIEELKENKEDKR